ncbi:EPIDERMAL PATTERNING FACTOR-like protein 9 isoform X2 [Ziziphus jujuba]|uniref:EPIDERMAL PATTERNING FACTOR-like protein 9 isoform X2 n=1 Tax=Ziziphus jujuba TaxID=326968 RepID=A0ABM3ZSH4_ZIZJJ|nr:EPIDERMAL PATTERNING FACTOR-like protein 9 isoform X2 [Ziziphus jujuba]
MAMALKLLLLFLTLSFAAYAIEESRTRVVFPYHQRVSAFSPPQKELATQGDSEVMKNPRRLMIGSTAPTCTYNECRGCRYKCRAEQVPVEGNDPINSAYHYRCVCHR